MDSVTQIVLGTAVGAAVGGRKYGRKAAVMGGLCGTFPDLDVLIPMGDPVSDFTYHRGFSHSFIFCIFITPILGFLFSRVKWFGCRFDQWHLHVMNFAVLMTHILLDAFTIYGTQLFWPSEYPPVGLGSVFIIDPLYTVPLFVSLIIYGLSKSPKIVYWGLVLSTAYLLFGVWAQGYVRSVVQETASVSSEKLLVHNSPFNTILWRVLIIEEDHYKVGYYSLLDQDAEIDFQRFSNSLELIQPIQESFAVKRIQWFTKGFYTVDEVDGDIIMRDLRMGLEPDQYVFSFVVGKRHEDTIIPVENERVPIEMDTSRLPLIWQRIWDHDVMFH